MCEIIISSDRNQTVTSPLLFEAVKTFEDALTVFTKADDSVQWALVKANLGITLATQSERSSGAARTQLLARAIKAFEDALTVYGPAFLPEKAESIAKVLEYLKAQILQDQAK